MNFLLKNKNKELNEDIRNVEYQYDLTEEKVNLQKFIEDVINNKSSIITENKQKI